MPSEQAIFNANYGALEQELLGLDRQIESFVATQPD